MTLDRVLRTPADVGDPMKAMVVDKDIPVPGVDGLSVRLRPRGAAATYGNSGRSGVTVSAGVQASGGIPPQVEVMVTFDVTQYLRNR